MYNAPIRKKATALLVAILAYSLIFPAYIFALPQGGQVVAGQADITNPSAVQMQINQATQKAIINWQQFSIAAPEAVNFTQPNAAAIALKRVVGVDPSVIYGSLTANGGVWVINPAGILVGSTGVINVNSFLASTLNIADEDFLAGNYTFSQQLNTSLASIVNQGTISAAAGQSVSLIAPGIANQGTIVASLGKVNLGAGEQVTVNFQGNELINFAVDKSVLGEVLGPDGEPLEDSILNEGTISAEGGEVVLSARTAYDAIKSVVNNKGVIEAQTVENNNGVIRLQGNDLGIVYNSGTLDVSGLDEGETGGEVEVTGEKTGLVHYSKIKASGRKGGGKVFVGGGFQGKNPSIKNGKITYVGKDAIIEADAIDEGDGGEVIVWADDTTRFYGNISATGGMYTGDGGFAEVSGKRDLDFSGLVNLSAPQGNGGTLLLDPRNITIATTGEVNLSSSGVNPVIFVTDDVGDTIIDDDTIVAQLNAGTSVTIGTTNTGGVNDGDIIVNAAIDSAATALDITTSDVTLLLDSYDDIFVNRDITGISTAGFKLNVALTAANNTAEGTDGTDNIVIGAAIDTIGGDFTINAAGDVSSTGAGTITTTASSLSNDSVASGAVDINVSGTGTVNLAGNLVTTGDDNSGGLGSAGGAVTIDTNNGTIALADITTSGGTGTAAAGGAAGTLTVTTATNNVITLNGSPLTAAGGTGTSQGAGATINFDDPVSLATGGVTITTGATGGDITFDQTLNSATAQTLALTSGTGNIVFTGTVGNSDPLDAVTVNAANDVTLGNTFASAGFDQAVSGAGTTLVSGLLTSTGAVTLDAATVDIDGGIDTTTGPATIDLFASNGVSISANVTSGDTTNINADNDNNGTGTLLVDSAATIDTQNNTLDITAAEINIDAATSVTSGGTAMTITASNGVGIGLGATDVGLHISDAELGKLTASSLELITTGSGDMTVDNVSNGNSTNVNAVTLTADGTVTFANNASTFNDSLIANADDGIAVNVDVNSTTGNLDFDGDADNANDVTDSIVFTGTRTLTASAGSIILDATGDKISSAALNLNAETGININDNLTSTGILTFDADTGGNGGDFAVADGATVNSGNNAINIDATDFNLNTSGSLNSGNGLLTITQAQAAGTIGLGTATKTMSISGAEFQNITTTATGGVSSSWPAAISRYPA